MDLAGPRGQWPATGHTAGPQQNQKSGPAQGQLLGKHVSGVAKGNSRALFPGAGLGYPLWLAQAEAQASCQTTGL